MGSRARVATATCLIACGLLLGSGGTATAWADSGSAASGDGRDERAHTDSGKSGPVASGEDPQRDVGRLPSPDPADDEETGTEADDDEDTGTDPADDTDPADGEEAGTETDDEQEAEKPRLPCCSRDDEDCEPGWPWPEDIDDRPGSDDGYGEGRPEVVPRPMPGGVFRPGVEPPLGEPEVPDVLDTVPGVGISGGGAGAPISVPVVVTAPAIGVAPAPRSATAGAGAGSPGGPRPAGTPPPRRTAPTGAAAEFAAPASVQRIGYGDYLRAAGLPQIAALALPGLAGLLVLTGAGGFVGYRQAKAGQGIRTSGIGRFMN
ncbi:hypothetical protein ACNUDN_26525 [Mycobacterium sp. smrl_JER01]|uniref:hypothetical protein n=1 Tax=Mycobacterium sp. smrl_JER01 TaxID=3402633 RepID=UPI003AC63EA7